MVLYVLDSFIHRKLASRIADAKKELRFPIVINVDWQLARFDSYFADVLAIDFMKADRKMRGRRTSESVRKEVSKI